MLDLNGLHKIELKIIGEGVPLKLELEKAANKLVDFGIQRVGADLTKRVVLVNTSRKAIRISFDVDD